MGFGIEHTGIQSFLEPDGSKNVLGTQLVVAGIVRFIPFLIIILLIFFSLSKRSIIFVWLFLLYPKYLIIIMKAIHFHNIINVM